MASFDISTLDILKISLSAHACLLLRALLGKVVDFGLPLLSPCSSKIRSLHRLHKWAPYLLPRIFSEQISLLVLTVLTLAALSHTSVSLIPFGHQPQPRPDFLIRVVLSVCTARYIMMTSWILLGREFVVLMKTETEPKVKVQTAAGECGSSIWDVLYFIVCAGTTLLSLAYRQNLLLAMTLPFQELSAIFPRYCQLVEISLALDSSRTATCNAAASRAVYKIPRSLTIVACVVCIVCRVVLPALFLALAVQRESPLVMDRLPLGWFVLSCASLCSFHIVLVYRAILNATGRRNCRRSKKDGKRLDWGLPFIGGFSIRCGGDGYLAAASMDVEDTRRATLHDKIGGNTSQRGKNHFLSIHDYPDSLTNDIYQDIALEKQDFNKCHIRDLNYGLLRPCDNRNVSFCAGISTDDAQDKETKDGAETLEMSQKAQLTVADKINVVRKKDMSKTWLLYRLLANSLSSSPSLSTTSISTSLPPKMLGSRQDEEAGLELDSWVFPALFDATSNTKLQRGACLLSSKPDSSGPAGKAGNPDTFLCDSNTLCVLENTLEPGSTSHRSTSSDVTSLTKPEHEALASTSQFLASEARRSDGDDRTVEIVGSETSAPPESTEFSDIKLAKKRFASHHTKQGYKGRYNISPDCVQLLSGSKDSLQGSFPDLNKEFSSV